MPGQRGRVGDRRRAAPRDGLARLTSAMTPTPARAAPAARRSGAGACGCPGLHLGQRDLRFARGEILSDSDEDPVQHVHPMVSSSALDNPLDNISRDPDRHSATAARPSGRARCVGVMVAVLRMCALTRRVRCPSSAVRLGARDACPSVGSAASAPSDRHRRPAPSTSQPDRWSVALRRRPRWPAPGRRVVPGAQPLPGARPRATTRTPAAASSSPPSTPSTGPSGCSCGVADRVGRPGQFGRPALPGAVPNDSADRTATAAAAQRDAPRRRAGAATPRVASAAPNPASADQRQRDQLGHAAATPVAVIVTAPGQRVEIVGRPPGQRGGDGGQRRRRRRPGRRRSPSCRPRLRARSRPGAGAGSATDRPQRGRRADRGDHRRRLALAFGVLRSPAPNRPRCPAPAWTWAVPPATSAVRMVIAVSASPAKSRYPTTPP